MANILPSKVEADRRRDEKLGKLHVWFYSPRTTLDCGHPPQLDDYFHGDAFRGEDGREVCGACVYAEKMGRILHCGHNPSPHRGCGTGTAHTPDDREICWTCADADQRAALLDADPRAFCAYLSEEQENGSRPVRYITTWTGGVLAQVTHSWSQTVWAWGRRQKRYYFNAVDVHGQQWYGQGPGPGSYCRMRRNKKQETLKWRAPIKTLGDKYPPILPETVEEELFLRLGTTSQPDQRSVVL